MSGRRTGCRRRGPPPAVARRQPGSASRYGRGPRSAGSRDPPPAPSSREPRRSPAPADPGSTTWWPPPSVRVRTRGLSSPVPWVPQAPVHPVFLGHQPLLRDLLLRHQVLIGRVFLGSADVEAAALVRVRERIPDVVVLVSRDDLQRWHDGEVVDPLGIVGGSHLESGGGQQLFRAAGLVPANGCTAGQRQERGGENDNVTDPHVNLLVGRRWPGAGPAVRRGRDRAADARCAIVYGVVTTGRHIGLPARCPDLARTGRSRAGLESHRAWAPGRWGGLCWRAATVGRRDGSGAGSIVEVAVAPVAPWAQWAARSSCS